jgi:2-polyprenyl-3-methyl-5-hydroxy-6-metoxy-1,4-benzoquinol methylase
MMHYEHCPLCGSPQIADFLSAKDYTVSQINFTIYKCAECTGAFTQDVPSLEEIGAFYASENYISHSDTQAGLVNNLYHRVRKKTLKTKLQLIKKVTGTHKGSLLDIGCGTGAFLHTMQVAGWQVTGLEPDAKARENAEKIYGIQPLPSGELFNLAAGTFDAITMWHVLEHVHQLHDYIKQAKNLLKENGTLVIAVPNYTSKDAAHYGPYWAAYDVPRHLYHFSPRSMKKLTEQHGMQVTQVKPMWYDSFYVSMLSEKYKSGKGNILGAFFTGLSSNLKAMGDTEKCSSLIYIIRKK